MDSTRILGCRVDALDEDMVAVALMADLLAFRLGQRGPIFVVTIGTEMVVRAQHDQVFREVISRAQYSLCDTIGILLTSRLRKGPLRARITGVSLLQNVCASLASIGGSIFLLGARDRTAELAGQRLANSYPGLRIAGARDGYFHESESDEVAMAIHATAADVLFVGLGSPHQEFWLDTHLKATGCAIGVGVGGSFDVISGRTSRAPQILQAMGLEWLYRLIQEPHRWRRQLALPHFIYLALRESLMATLPRRSARR